MKSGWLAILLALPLAAADVKLTVAGGNVEIAIDGEAFSTFYMGPEGNKPYLHPLRTAEGQIITRQYPMAEVAGESRDHKHHRGLWFTHGDVNGLDFWANDPSYDNPKIGKVAWAGVVSVKSGRKSGMLESVFHWTAPDGRRLIEERRQMTFYSEAVNRTVDIDVTLKALEKVTFGDTKEGTFAIRIADALSETRKGGQLRNAGGAMGMKNVWGKPSPWVDYSGTLEGQPVGIAIFDHPQNPKHPTFWHARDYGLFAANIFGEHDFFNDKSRNGGMTLEPGRTLRFRYRVVIHPGDAKSAGIAKLYEQYK